MLSSAGIFETGAIKRDGKLVKYAKYLDGTMVVGEAVENFLEPIEDKMLAYIKDNPCCSWYDIERRFGNI